MDDLFGDCTIEHYDIYEDYYGMARKYKEFEFNLILGDTKETSDGLIYGISTISKDISIVKSIHIGDGINDIVSKFPDEKNTIIENPDFGTIKVLYGTVEHMKNSGYIFYENNEVKEINYIEEGTRLRFYMDNDVLIKITLSMEN